MHAIMTSNIMTSFDIKIDMTWLKHICYIKTHIKYILFHWPVIIKYYSNITPLSYYLYYEYSNI